MRLSGGLTTKCTNDSHPTNLKGQKDGRATSNQNQPFRWPRAPLFRRARHPERTASDFRDLPRVQTESWMRRDPLTGDWAIYAAHRQNRTFLPPANDGPLAPTRLGQHPSEIPEDDYQITVLRTGFRRFVCTSALRKATIPTLAEMSSSTALLPSAAARSCVSPQTQTVHSKISRWRESVPSSTCGRSERRSWKPSMMSLWCSRSRIAARRLA